MIDVRTRGRPLDGRTLKPGSTVRAGPWRLGRVRPGGEVEVVAALEPLDGAAGEAGRHPRGHGLEPFVAQAAVGEVHRAGIGTEGVLVDGAARKRPEHRRDSGRAQSHLGCGRQRGWWGDFDARAEHGLEEPLHLLVRREIGEPGHPLGAQQRPVLFGEVGGGLVQRDARHPVRVLRDVGERDRAAERVADEVDGVVAQFRHEPVEPLDLVGERVVVRDPGVGIDLEVLELALDVIELGGQHRELRPRGIHDPGQEDHSRHRRLRSSSNRRERESRLSRSSPTMARTAGNGKPRGSARREGS